MQIRIRRTLLLVIICAAAYTAYRLVYPTVDVRYRLNIEVQAGGKRYSSSSVIDAEWEQASYFRIAGGSMLITSRSPCASVDLGTLGILFIVDALPRLVRPGSDVGNGVFLYPHAERLSLLPYIIYPVRPIGAGYVENLLYHEPVTGRLAGKVEVPLDRLPMIVRFRDGNDPNSLEELDPKDLSNAYGSGSRVVRATLEMTTDGPSPMPAYWPTWIAEDNSSYGLRVAFPPGTTNGETAAAADFISIEQFKGFSR